MLVRFEQGLNFTSQRLVSSAGFIEKGGSLMGIATAPEFIWELGLGIYPIIWGFRASSPILAPDRNSYA